jgi:hypothetical protein
VKPIRFKLAAPGVIVLSGLAAVAPSQIDSRVNRGNATTAGRALDSNSAVGGSRFNVTRPDTFDAGRLSNAVISGNLTGLGRFHAESPIPNSNQFRVALPSADLAGFRAASVGLQDVKDRPVQSPTFYFDRDTTVSDLGHVIQGRNLPGSSMLFDPTAPPATPTVRHDESNARLSRIIREPTDTRVGISTPPELTPGLTQIEIGGRIDLSASPDRRSAYRSALKSSIFGAPVPDPFRARPVGADPGTTPDPLSDSTPGAELMNPMSDGLVEDVRDRLVDPGGARRIGAPPPEGGTTEAAPQSRDQFAELRVRVFAAGPDEPLPRITRPDSLGNDRFADFHTALELARAMGVTDLGFELPGARPGRVEGQAEADAEPRGPIGTSVLRKPSEGIRQLTSAAAWAGELLDDPIQSFAGKHRNDLNRFLEEGEAALKRSEFYTAARFFELAHAADPTNPLPLLARGHALAAAGDYMTAVYSLSQGIERFPGIAAFRIDLPAIVGRPDIFDIRRADLEDKLKRVESFELRFLLGYLELYSGLPDEGLRNLRLAAHQAPQDSVIAAFPDLVTGRRPLSPNAD